MQDEERAQERTEPCSGRPASSLTLHHYTADPATSSQRTDV